MVQRRCRGLLRDEDEAQDAAQEVFVRVLKSSHRLSNRYPSSLLYRVATNVCLNRLRDRSRRPTLSGDDILARIATTADLDTPLLLERLLGRHPESHLLL
jgi:RNA polymerase sigma-70 factor (ECF subfamily)